MPDNNVQIIKNRLDIVEIIGDKVKLRRAGRNFIGLCPFHNEKTPSFIVSPEKQNYHCFGCGKGGDIFTFVMETDGLDFHQALEVLADRAGVTLSRFSSKNKEFKTKDLYDVMNLACQYFSRNLRSHEGVIARAYMQRRNLTALDAARFNLGWSFRSWNGLLNFLKNNGVTERQSLAAGLIIENDNGGFYDRFRGRLIFPVKDLTGRIIAFGGRLVDGEGAKYINSPEGEIYSKRNNLYLLNDAKNAIRERGRAILVEGYMDAVRLHISGFNETVASLGTSLTPEQAKLIKRFSDNCYICYDGDEAGQEAALRGMYVLQENGLDVKIISLSNTNFKDPDELLSSPDGRELFNNALKNAQPLVLYHLYAVKKYLNSSDKRRHGVNSLFSGLAHLEPSDIAPYIEILAGAMQLKPENFWNELDNYKKDEKYKNENASADNGDLISNFDRYVTNGDIEGALTPDEKFECVLCALLWNNQDIRRNNIGNAAQVTGLIQSERVRVVTTEILTDNIDELEERWLSVGNFEPMNFITAGEKFGDEMLNSRNDKIKDENDLWNYVCSELQEKKKTRRYDELKDKMFNGEADDAYMMKYYAAAVAAKVRKAV